MIIMYAVGLGVTVISGLMIRYRIFQAVLLRIIGGMLFWLPIEILRYILKIYTDMSLGYTYFFAITSVTLLSSCGLIYFEHHPADPPWQEQAPDSFTPSTKDIPSVHIF